MLLHYISTRTHHSSFRLAAATAEHLERRADETGESRARLAERYIEEGLRMDEHPYIVFRDAGAGRAPSLVGTRLDVWQVIETIRNSDNSVEEAAGYLSLPEAMLRACVAYYSAYKEEIDAWTRRVHEIAEREEAVWRRTQEVLG